MHSTLPKDYCASGVTCMETTRWKQSFSINVAELDRQHKRLFDTVAELEYSLNMGRADTIIDEVLAKVVAHTIEHFAAEEALMYENGFPDLAAHCHEHSMLSQQLTTFNLSHMAGRQGVPVALLEFLKTWLQEHILKSDKKYCDFLNTRLNSDKSEPTLESAALMRQKTQPLS